MREYLSVFVVLGRKEDEPFVNPHSRRRDPMTSLTPSMLALVNNSCPKKFKGQKRKVSTCSVEVFIIIKNIKL